MRNADVLDRMIAGESVEASPEVRELAQLAALLQGAWGEAPTKASTNRTMAAAMEAFQGNGNGNGQAATMPLPVVARPSRGRRIAVRLALAAALVIGLPVTALAASGDARPGQLMYPVKRGFEEIRLALAGDPVAEAGVLLDFAGERVEEAMIAGALGEQDSAAQALEGYKEAVARFDGRILEAQELGLPVEGLTTQAEGLFAGYGQLLEALFGPPPAVTASEEVPEVPVEVSASGGASGGEDAKGAKGRAGGGKNKNKSNDARGGSGNRNQNAGGGGGDESSGGGGGNGGGGSGGGGAAGGAAGAGDTSGNCGNGNGRGGAPGTGAGNGNGNTCGPPPSAGDVDDDEGKKDDPPKQEEDGEDEAGDDEGSGDGSSEDQSDD